MDQSAVVEIWGGNISTIAGVSSASPLATATGLMRQFLATNGSLYRKPLLAGHEDLLRELTAAKSNITLAEIQAALMARGIEAGCLTTIWSTLRRLGLSHKKTC